MNRTTDAVARPFATDCETICQNIFGQVKLILTDPVSYRASASAWRTAAERIKTLPDDYATYAELLAELEPTVVGRNRTGPFRLLDADMLKILSHYFKLAATAREVAGSVPTQLAVRA